MYQTLKWVGGWLNLHIDKKKNIDLTTFVSLCSGDFKDKIKFFKPYGNIWPDNHTHELKIVIAWRKVWHRLTEHWKGSRHTIVDLKLQKSLWKYLKTWTNETKTIFTARHHLNFRGNNLSILLLAVLGFIPKSRNYFACSYSETCRKALTEFYQDGRVKIQRQSTCQDLPVVVNYTNQQLEVTPLSLLTPPPPPPLPLYAHRPNYRWTGSPLVNCPS